MDIIYTILAFLIGFTIMVLVHEWGHYITGRLFGVKIDEFAIGMGPKLFSRKGKKNGVLFSVRAVPIGGFVRFAGDEEAYGDKNDVELAPDDPHLLQNLKVWKRFIIYAAGAFMNLVLGFLLIVILFLSIGEATTIPPKIGQVIDGSPAQSAGLRVEDVILKVNGVDIDQTDFDKALEQFDTLLGSEPVTFTVRRGKEIVDITVTPQFSEADGAYKVGFYFGYSYKPMGLGTALSVSAQTSFEMMGLIFKSLGDLIFKGEGVENISGPVGIVSYVYNAARDGIISIVNIFAALSLNLAVMNMLPFPALDGGKCVLLILEAIRRKPLSQKVEGWLNVAGFMLLMLLMVLVSANDLIKIF